MFRHPLISICIPSFNRPNELNRLLKSFNTIHINEVQIVICEDMAPKRNDVRKVVDDFNKSTEYKIKYIENKQNYGHGKNLRECMYHADGEYILFMGDDDMFIPGKFDQFFKFVFENRHVGYFLRSYAIKVRNKIQYFKYYNSDKFFNPGLTPYVEFFNKSVSMSGFTIKRDFVIDFNTEIFDDTLLFQLYLVSEVCLNHPSAYCNTPFTYVVSDGKSFFGVNKKEKGKYEVGRKVSDNINFITGRYKITEFIDTKYGLQSTELIIKDTSKYCFYILAESRSYGINYFITQRKLFIDAGLNKTIYYYIYYYALLIGGVKNCVSIIKFIKSIAGRRLNL